MAITNKKTQRMLRKGLMILAIQGCSAGEIYDDLDWRGAVVLPPPDGIPVCDCPDCEGTWAFSGSAGQEEMTMTFDKSVPDASPLDFRLPVADSRHARFLAGANDFDCIGSLCIRAFPVEFGHVDPPPDMKMASMAIGSLPADDRRDLIAAIDGSTDLVTVSSEGATIGVLCRVGASSPYSEVSK